MDFGPEGGLLLLGGHLQGALQVAELHLQLLVLVADAGHAGVQHAQLLGHLVVLVHHLLVLLLALL